MSMPRLTACAALLSLILLLPSASASCAPFLSASATTPVEVTQGTTAVFTVTITNTGTQPQLITVDTLCDPSFIQCPLPDVSLPINLAPFETIRPHIRVDTSRVPPGDYAVPIQVWSGLLGSRCTEEMSSTLRVLATAGASNPTPTPQVTASISPPGSSATRAGEAITYTLFIQNNLPEKQFVAIKYGASEGNFFETSTTLSTNDFDLAPLESKTITAKVLPPASTPGGSYPFVFKARATSSSGTVYDAPLRASLFVYSPVVALYWESWPAAGECINAFATNSTTRTYRLKNYAEATGPFDVELQAGDDVLPYLKLDKKKLELNQGESTDLALTASVPGSLAQGTSPFTLLVKYGANVVLRLEDCVSVYQVTDASFLEAATYRVVRGTQESIPFTITNNGTLELEYAIDYSPNPVAGINLSFNPTSVKLAPGQSATLSANLRISKAISIGKKNIPFYVRASNLSKEAVLRLDVAKNNNTSPLSIDATGFVAYEGLAAQVAVPVSNDGNDDFPQVELVVEGLPQDWVSVDTPPKDVQAGGKKDFLLTLTVPEGTNTGGRTMQVIPMTIHAVSGLESVSKTVGIQVITPIRKLETSIAGVDTPSPGEAVVSIKVSNQGNLRLTSLSPSLPYTGQYVAIADPALDLAPGESNTAVIHITPQTQAPEQDVFLRLQSTEGAGNTVVVHLPALTRKEIGMNDTEVIWKLIAIALILAAIFFLLAKEDIEQIAE